VFRPSPAGSVFRGRERRVRQFIEQRIAATITRTGAGRQPFFIT